MDLRKRVPIGAGIAEADNGMGYDHNYVLRGEVGADGLRPVARVFEPESGRWMTARCIICFYCLYSRLYYHLL